MAVTLWSVTQSHSAIWSGSKLMLHSHAYDHFSAQKNASRYRGLDHTNSAYNTRVARPCCPHEPGGCQWYFFKISKLFVDIIQSLFVQQCQLVAPLQLYFSFRSAFMNGQVCRLWEDRSESTDRRVLWQLWRIATTFFYFGSISLDFIFHLFFLYVILTRCFIPNN